MSVPTVVRSDETDGETNETQIKFTGDYSLSFMDI